MNTMTEPSHPEETGTASASAPVLPVLAIPPPSHHPTPMPTPPQSPAEDILGSRTMSTGFTTSSRTSRLRKEYLSSLHVPSEEEIAIISSIQRSREAELKQRSRELSRKSSAADGISDSTPLSSTGPTRSGHEKRSLSILFNRGRSGGKEDSKHDKAAARIQKTYRGYRVRREMKGLGIDASTRWSHAIREAQFRQLTAPQARATGGPNGNSDAAGGTTMGAGNRPAGSRTSTAARQNWKKVGTIVRRAGGDMDNSSDDSSSPSSSSSSSSGSESETEKKRREEARARRKRDAQMMGLQYFLEMIDLKHRYGANLCTYHDEWKEADTHESFFYWLDYGEGRFVEIGACPREVLDREQVRYLSREERQYYLVTVDEEGRLCWAKNGARIDTTEQWKDSIHGVVPADDPTPCYTPLAENETRLLGDSSTGASSSSDSDSEHDHDHDHGHGHSHGHGPSQEEAEAAQAAKYATPGFDKAKGTKKVTHMSASTLFNKLLRKSVRKNTWIFVADTSFRLYVGIKDSGAFQHSSFLQGSRISAAGLIKIKNGRLASLSPLSGHYRPPASNFRAFVTSLRDEGVDMKHVSISKSYAILVGLETYVKTKRKSKDVLKKVTNRRDRLIAPGEVRRKEDDEKDGSQSAARERELLAQEEKEREDNSVGVRVMQRLGIHPSEPDG